MISIKSIATFKHVYEHHNDLKLPNNDNNVTMLKRIDTRVLSSVLCAINENGMIQKTPLMEKTRLDYSRLNSYLNWLEITECIRVSDRNISLTENGIKLCAKFLN